MNNNEVKNSKKEIPQTKDMNDRDYLNDILEQIKNLSDNLSIAINEASNQKLFEKYKTMFLSVKEAQRALYNLMFKNGWYTLEKADTNKIQTKLDEFSTKLEEL
ncbi:MAG: spore coat protein [Bacilli bacterium]|nr:spore coat protein [Bacilli bacterium]